MPRGGTRARPPRVLIPLAVADSRKPDQNPGDGCAPSGDGRRAPGFDPKALWQALRVKQWVKNGFLFAGILFTLDKPHPAADWLRVLAAFAVFCALSSAIYLVNDVCDVEQDRR